MTLNYGEVSMQCLCVLDEVQDIPIDAVDKFLTTFKFRVQIGNITYYTMDKPFTKDE